MSSFDGAKRRASTSSGFSTLANQEGATSFVGPTEGSQPASVMVPISPERCCEFRRRIRPVEGGFSFAPRGKVRVEVEVEVEAEVVETEMDVGTSSGRRINTWIDTDIC